MGRALALAALAFVLGAAGVIYALYEADIGRARAAVTGGGRVAQTAAGPIEYTSVGAGLPVLSIHGAGGGYDQGLANVAGFFDSHFRVIAPSRFGYLGTSVPPDASPEAQADAHTALLDALGISKVVVIGASAGALSAIQMALRHPDRVMALILISPASYSPDSPPAIDATASSQFAFKLVLSGADFVWWAAERVAPAVLIRFLGVPPELVAAAAKADRDRVAAVVASVEPLSARLAGLRIDSAGGLKREPLEKITAPTLILAARDDLFNTAPAAQFAASLIPGAELKLFDTGGHLLVGHQQDTKKLVADFLLMTGVTLGK